MNIPPYLPCLFIQNLLNKLPIDTKRYHSYKYNLKPEIKQLYKAHGMQVVPLHDYPHFIEQCCDLVNSEWKRSKTARMRSLETSCDNLPTNLILVDGKDVIGHSKLTIIPSIQDACFLESVVIDKELRGKGYGKFLMNKIEQHCRAIGLKTIYLSTKDKANFYEKLGYSLCAPVSIYGQYLRSISPSSNKFNLNKSGQSSKIHYVQTSLQPPSEYITSQNGKVFMCKVL